MVTGRRPQALLITPIAPARGGNGLAMRAGLLLEALARDHRVVVWCVPVAGGPLGGDNIVVAPLEVDPAWTLARRAGSEELWTRPELCRFTTHRALAALRAQIGLPDFDVTLVLRSYLLPFAEPLDRAGGRLGLRVVDLDDDEEQTRHRLARLMEQAGDHEGARREEREAELLRVHEERSLPWADLLLSAQREHVSRLRGCFPEARVAHLPNVIDTQSWSGSLSVSGGTALRLLFVGNLSYLPNQAAARELVGEIVPILRARGLEVEVRLVGRHPSPELHELARLPGVSLWPDVSDLRPHYAWADQVVLPLRAGGGTRIKILEAFAAGVAVISTSLGAEGLDVEDGVHLILADSVDELVEGSLRLAVDRDLAAGLVRRAGEWVQLHHDRCVIVEGLADQLSESGEVAIQSGEQQPRV